jgi:hypothetical protein
MATHERELTDPVELCLADGRTLNPDARGWSRTPLHTANLRGGWGRTKRWDYWCVLSRDLAVAVTYADVDYLGLATVWWVDLATGATGGREASLPLARGVALPDRPGTEPLTYRGKRSVVEIVDDPGGTTITGAWTERDGRSARLDVRVDLPAGHESLNVVIPWDDERFNYTSKHQARPATGVVAVGDRRWEVGGAAGDAWGVLDVGRGRWPSEVTWNWGGGAGRAGDHVVGLQFGAKWTEGSGYTENGVLVDGRLTKLGNELTWDYDWDEPMAPWRVVDPGGQLDATLAPRYDKHTTLPGRDRGSETHQVFGTWSGRLRTDDGLELSFTGLQGFAEEARQEW